MTRDNRTEALDYALEMHRLNKGGGSITVGTKVEDLTKDADAIATWLAAGADDSEGIATQIQNLLDIQADNITDEYMRGMYNGLACALACVTGETPEYLEAPPADDLEIRIGGSSTQWPQAPWASAGQITTRAGALTILRDLAFKVAGMMGQNPDATADEAMEHVEAALDRFGFPAEATTKIVGTFHQDHSPQAVVDALRAHHRGAPVMEDPLGDPLGDALASPEVQARVKAARDSILSRYEVRTEEDTRAILNKLAGDVLTKVATAGSTGAWPSDAINQALEAFGFTTDTDDEDEPADPYAINTNKIAPNAAGTEDGSLGGGSTREAGGE